MLRGDVLPGNVGRHQCYERVEPEVGQDGAGVWERYGDSGRCESEQVEHLTGTMARDMLVTLAFIITVELIYTSYRDSCSASGISLR